MALVDPSVTVTIAGNDISSDVQSLSTEQDICSMAQTCTIVLDATSGAHAYDPWDALVVAINGTNRLIGYVVDAVKSRQSYMVQGIDKMKLALDWFIPHVCDADEYIDGDCIVLQVMDAGWWLDYWLTKVGITTSGSVSTNLTVPVDTDWKYTAVSDIIKECLAYAGDGWLVVVDGDGIAQIMRKMPI